MMRTTMRHVAVLAAAVVMLTALAVSAQSKGPLDAGMTIDHAAASADCSSGIDAYAWDESGRTRSLIVIVYRQPGAWVMALDKAEGSGLLEVALHWQIPTQGDLYEAQARMYSQNKQTGDLVRLLEQRTLAQIVC